MYRGKRKDGEKITDQGFQEGHPLRDTHVLRIRKHEVIPILNGKKLISICNESTVIEKETNSIIALILHNPFRNALIDLKGIHPTWYDAFKNWKPSPEIKQLLMNAYDFDIARRRAGEISREQKNEARSGGSDSSSDDDSDNIVDDDGFIPSDEFGSDANLFNSDYSNIDLLNFENDKKDPVRFPNICIPSTRTQKCLDKINGNNLFRRNIALLSDRMPQLIVDQKKHLVIERTKNSEELKEWIKNSTSHNYCLVADIVEENNSKPNVEVIETKVIELSHALMKENCAWKDIRLKSMTPLDKIPQIKKQAFISDISYAYNLNKLQHVAFELIATSLLRRWLHREEYRVDVKRQRIDVNKIDSIDSEDQICMVLVGEGGTGKSRVINAVDALCLAWSSPNCLIKAAPTGKAAVLIRGKTLAKVIINLHHSSQTHNCGISCIIIDEMSMMTLKDLHVLDVELRRITGIKTLFGGISIILCGDFLQLPPAGGKPLYKNPLNIGEKNETIVKGNEIDDDMNEEDMKELQLDLEKIYESHRELKQSPKKQKSQQQPKAEEINAFDIWYNHFTTVVYLVENMRFLNDPEWGEELAKARKGIWSTRLIEIINDRLLLSSQSIKLDSIDIANLLVDTVVSLPDPSNPKTMSQTVFATPSNSSKQAINHTFTKAISNCLPDNVFPIRVVADFWGKLDGLSDQDKAYIMGLDESKFGRLAPFLDLVIGMPVMVTQNEEPLKGIANGTFAVLEDIQFPSDTLFRLVYDEILEVEVLVPSKLPLLAWIRTDRGEGASAPPVNGDESLMNRKDLFPVYPCQPYRPGSEIKLPVRGSSSKERSIKNLKITQLPIIPCSASTAYKLQGETLNSEVIVDWKSEMSIINRRQQAYLMLSRCTTREALITLNPFTDYLAKWFVPDQDVLHADNRLKTLHNILMKKMEINDEEVTYSRICTDSLDKKAITKAVTNNNTLNNNPIRLNSHVNISMKADNSILEYGELKVDDNTFPRNPVQIQINNEVVDLLRERKRLLTDDEKDIVEKSLYCNDENAREIIIQRYGIYFIKRVFITNL